MTDWADETAQAFLDNLDCSELDIVEGPDAPFQRLGALLRKAKADGMREAANFNTVWRLKAEAKTFAAFQTYCSEVHDVLMARADTIEKGEE